MAERPTGRMRWRTARPYLLFAILACASFPGVLAGRALVPADYQQQWAPWGVLQSRPGRLWNPIQADGILQFYPWRHYARQALADGEIPLWNPHQLCGTPFVANGQSAVFYPPNVVFWLIPTRYAFGASAVLHLFAAGTFAYWLGRAIGLRRSGATLSGVVLMLGGFTITWMALPTLVNALVWLPLALCAAKRHFDGANRSRWALVLALAVACALLAGHLQIAYYALVTVVAWLVHLSIGSWRHFGLRAALGAALGSAAAVGLGVTAAAVQLLPMAELAALGHRQGPTDFEGLTQWALNRYELARLVAPDLLGNPSRGWYVSPLTQNYTEMCGYVGVATLVLMGPALWLAWTRRADARGLWFFIGLGVVALLIALGTPVARLAFEALPGFDRFSGLPRILCLFQLAGALIAGAGLEAVRRRPPAVAALVAALIAGILLAQAAPDALDADRRAATPVVVGLALLVVSVVACRLAPVRCLPAAMVALLALDLLWFGHGYNLTVEAGGVYETRPVLSRLAALPPDERVLAITDSWPFGAMPQSTLPPNAAMVFGLRDIQGYDSLFPGHVKTALMQANGGAQPCPLTNGNLVLLGQNGGLSTLSPEWLARMRVTHILSRTPPPREWGFAVAEEALPGLMLYSRTGPLEDPKVTSLGANYCEVSGEGGVIAETYYPGWYGVSADGLLPLPLAPDGVFRASPEGITRHVYLPGSFAVGAFLSLTALAVGAGLWAFGRWSDVSR